MLNLLNHHSKGLKRIPIRGARGSWKTMPKGPRGPPRRTTAASPATLQTPARFSRRSRRPAQAPGDTALLSYGEQTLVHAVPEEEAEAEGGEDAHLESAEVGTSQSQARHAGPLGPQLPSRSLVLTPVLRTDVTTQGAEDEAKSLTPSPCSTQLIQVCVFL